MINPLPQPPTPPTPASTSEPLSLPPNVLRLVAPMALSFVGVGFLAGIATLVFRVIWITVHLDGSAVGVSLAQPSIDSLGWVTVTCGAVLTIVLLGVNLAEKLLAMVLALKRP